MLTSEYVEGISLLPFDEKISEAIVDAGVDGGGKEMVVGVRNLDGEVFRVVRAHGLGAYMHIVSALSDMGLKDELKDNLAGKDGFDSLFFLSDELKTKIQQRSLPSLRSPLDEIEAHRDKLSELSETERNAVIQSRVGQGSFRQKLIDYWKKCAVSECELISLLRASHIKPWSECNNSERLDVFNGLLLAPNLDAAFDAGYVSFENTGKIIISDHLSSKDAYQLRISSKLKLKSKMITDQHKVYLDYHRKQVFKNG